MQSTVSETAFGMPRQYLPTTFKCNTSNIWNKRRKMQTKYVWSTKITLSSLYSINVTLHVKLCNLFIHSTKGTLKVIIFWTACRTAGNFPPSASGSEIAITFLPCLPLEPALPTKKPQVFPTYCLSRDPNDEEFQIPLIKCLRRNWKWTVSILFNMPFPTGTVLVKLRGIKVPLVIRNRLEF